MLAIAGLMTYFYFYFYVYFPLSNACVTWLIYMCDMTHVIRKKKKKKKIMHQIALCTRHGEHDHTCERTFIISYVWNDPHTHHFIRVIWLAKINDEYPWPRTFIILYVCHDSLHTCDANRMCFTVCRSWCVSHVTDSPFMSGMHVCNEMNACVTRMRCFIRVTHAFEPLRSTFHVKCTMALYRVASYDALSLLVIFRERALYIVALLRKMICNLRHPTGLRHPVLHVWYDSFTRVTWLMS